MFRVICSKKTFESGKALANALEAELSIASTNSSSLASTEEVTINYGSSVPIKTNGILLNEPEDVKKAINKKITFDLLKGNVPIPTYSVNKEDAKKWIKGNRIVVCRKLANSNNSEGIVFASTDDELVDAPLYTRYIKHENEYRVNCFNNQVISVYKKQLVNTTEPHFKFILQPSSINKTFQSFCENVHNNLGLNIFGMDIIETQLDNKYLLEVNSGPILFPHTVNKLSNLLYKEFVNV